MKLTQRFVATAPAKGTDSWYADDEVRGLGLRVWPRADGVIARMYFLRYRCRGPQRKLRIGDPTRMSLEQAAKKPAGS